MRYSPAVIKHGTQLQREAEERPATFATYNGEADVVPDENLVGSNSVRKAGPGGQRALELMTNPIAQKETKQWMDYFGQSNEGFAFNQSAMQQAAMGVKQ